MTYCEATEEVRSGIWKLPYVDSRVLWYLFNILKKSKVVILGGGPSALGVALGLVDAGWTDITIVERAASLGGLSGSFELDGMILDYGPHRFSPEFPELTQRLKTLLGDELVEVDNEHAVFFRERVYHYPPRLSQFLNWDSIRYSSEVLFSYFSGKLQWRGKSTFEDRIVGSFGRTLYRDVVHPLCSKVWGEPEELDPNFAELRFSVPTFVSWGKKALTSKTASRDKSFYYPKGGFQEIWNALGTYLENSGVRIQLQTTPVSLEIQENRAVSLSLVKGRDIQVLEMDWLISTIPVASFSKLFANPLAFPIGDFKNRGMLLVVFLLKRESCLPARVVIFPESRYAFNRLSEQNQFSRDTVPVGKCAIQADILAELSSSFWKLSDDEIINKVKEEVISLNFFGSEEIEETYLIRVPTAYPIPSQAREAAQQILEAELSQFENILCTGRFASSDYNNSHTALKKGMLCADHIIGKLSHLEWREEAGRVRQLPIRD